MDDVKHQIDAWRAQKSLSEFDPDIRTLYELCAGNVTISRGREGKTVPVEDRAETFNISTRYNLDWLQCFALGLFYGKEEKNNNEGKSRIENAIREYQARRDRGEEPVEQPENDTMWSLLKLYAADKAQGIEVPSFPAALEGLAKPWDHSDVFTFYQTMNANLPVDNNTTRADDLAETLASELSSRSDIASAIYVLLHISNPAIRTTQIQSLLDRFAGQITNPDTAVGNEGIHLWRRLTTDLKIPEAWIYMSMARFAAAVSKSGGGDNVSELRYLVAAEAWEEANECLLRRVAPSFVVDEDWTGLREMCKLFGDEPARRVEGWYDGGDVYASFGQLMTGMTGKNDAVAIASLRKRIVAMGNKHTKAKDMQSLGKMSRHELEEHVAIKEMANGLARLANQGCSVGSLEEILELPMTQDVRDEIKMAMGVVEDGVTAEKEKTTGRRTRSQGQGLGVQEDQEMREGEDTTT